MQIEKISLISALIAVELNPAVLSGWMHPKEEGIALNISSSDVIDATAISDINSHLTAI